MLYQLILAALASVVASQFDPTDPGLIVETFTSAPVIWQKTFSEAAQGTQTGPLPRDLPIDGLVASAFGKISPGFNDAFPTFMRRWWYAYHNTTMNRTMTTTTLFKTRKFITTYYSNGTVVKTEVDGR